MNPLVHTLASGVLSGRWTMEDLDQPTAGWRDNAKAVARNRSTIRNNLDPTPNLVRNLAEEHQNWPELIQPCDSNHTSATAAARAQELHQPAAGLYGTPASRRKAALQVSRYDALFGSNPELLACPSTRPRNVPMAIHGPIGCWRA